MAMFARLLPIAALCHGEVVNISGLARDSGVARTTVQGYLDILEDTLHASRLPGFEARLRVRERRHPKLYWVDPGLVRAVKKLRGPIAPEERGALLEGWVLHLLRAYGEENDLYEDLRYWAPHPANRTEVDFLLRRGDEFAAIEVKAPRRYHTGMLPGLRAVAELPGMVRRVPPSSPVARGRRRRQRLPESGRAPARSLQLACVRGQRIRGRALC